MMHGKKGEGISVEGVVIGLVLLLILFGLGLMWINSSSKISTTVLSTTTLCSGGTLGQGECLDSQCGGRAGWTSIGTPLGKDTCPNGGTCCILTNKHAWFSPPSFIISYGSSDLKANYGQAITLPVTSAPIAFYYVPRSAPAPTGSTGQVVDQTCPLTIGGAPLGSVGDPSASCTARAGGTLGAVLLFNGTGKDLRSKCTDPCSLVLTVTTSPPGAEPSLGWAVITWNYPITFATAMTVKG